MPYKNEEQQDNYQREYQYWYRRLYDWIRYEKMDAQLGTTSFNEYIERNPDGSPDFKAEHTEIKKELQKVLHSGYKQYGSRRKHLRHRFLDNNFK